MDYIFYKVMVGGLVHVQYILSIFHFSTVLEYFGTLVWLSCRNHWQVTHLLISVASVCSSVRFKLDFLFRSLIYWPAQWYLMAKFYFSVKNRINIFQNIWVFLCYFIIRGKHCRYRGYQQTIISPPWEVAVCNF